MLDPEINNCRRSDFRLIKPLTLKIKQIFLTSIIFFSLIGSCWSNDPATRKVFESPEKIGNQNYFFSNYELIHIFLRINDTFES